MQILDPAKISSWHHRSAVALGVFDGVHIGHQKLISQMVSAASAAGLPSVCLTFDPHPMQIIQPRSAPRLITSVTDRLDLLSPCGVDYALVVPFTKEISLLEGRQFAQAYLQDMLAAAMVFVGFNYRFGVKGTGTPDALAGFGSDMGFTVHVVPAIELAGKTVSSTAIRQAIASGDVVKAASMLGRPFDISGTVQREHGRGRTLGFPTANIKLADSVVEPRPGVYAVMVAGEFSGFALLPAVANYGQKPTFGAHQRSLEIHIFDFDDNIYGCEVQTTFVDYLREERSFASADELCRQISRDCSNAQRILDQYSRSKTRARHCT